MANEPEWLLAMRAISGMSETPGSADNPKILAMRDEIARTYPEMKSYCNGYQHDSTPWCGLAVAYCMTKAGVRPVFGPTDTDKFLWAQAWDDPSFGSKISAPRLGCVVVMKREGGGHVTLYESTKGDKYVCRGGNQSDAVNAQSYPKSNVIALVWPKEAGELPPAPRRDLEEGDSGSDVESVQTSLGLPVDGDFGPTTEGGVMGFQAAVGLTVDGEVGSMTWSELDKLDAKMAAGAEDLVASQIEAIVGLVGNSTLRGYSWKDRGRAPQGYLEGMALTFGVALQQLHARNPAAIDAAKAKTPDQETDALAWYASEFSAAGMDNSKPGAATLRHLFVMLIGLGMRESSGKYYEGRDMSATNVAADTAEAGLFQASWNLASCSPHIKTMFDTYFRDPHGFLPFFRKGLTPTPDDLPGFGTGQGAAYQWLAKYAPAFAAMMTAVGLRKRRKHWGPINRKEVELVAEANDLLRSVERVITSGPVVEPEPPTPGPGPWPEPEPPTGAATVDISAAGPVVITVNGETISGDWYTEHPQPLQPMQPQSESMLMSTEPQPALLQAPEPEPDLEAEPAPMQASSTEPPPESPRKGYHAVVRGGYYAQDPENRSLPLPVRTNNPSALNTSAAVQKIPGYKGSTEATPGNHTAVFWTPEYGVMAFWNLLKRYRESGQKTVGEIIKRYSGQEAYSEYWTYVLQRSGLPASYEIALDGSDDNGLMKLAKAMFGWEAGDIPLPWSDLQIQTGFILGQEEDALNG